MDITIDGKKLSISDDVRNIVDAADQAGIGIPAPCYRSKISRGCCKACVVDIDGSRHFACSTKPAEGMNITVDRPDLKQLRKQRIAEYRTNPPGECDCNCSCNSTSNCC